MITGNAIVLKWKSTFVVKFQIMSFYKTYQCISATVYHPNISYNPHQFPSLKPLYESVLSIFSCQNCLITTASQAPFSTRTCLPHECRRRDLSALATAGAARSWMCVARGTVPVRTPRTTSPRACPPRAGPPASDRGGYRRRHRCRRRHRHRRHRRPAPSD